MAKKKAIKKAVKKTKPTKKKAVKKTKASKKNTAKKVSLIKKKVVKKQVFKKAKAKPVKKKPVKTTSTKKTAPKKAKKQKTIKTKSNIEVKHFEKPTFVPHVTSLKEGSLAPHFEGLDQHGNIIRSSDLLGKNVILYFYPKDHTDGCTAESCSLRDEHPHFSDNNYVVVGVSADSVDSHKKFADNYMLPFSLIADTEKRMINAYNVWGQKQLAGRIYDGIVRTTFVIDQDGVIKHIVTKVDSANHAQQLRNL